MFEHCYPLTSSEVRAWAELTVQPGAGAAALRWRSAPPVVLRQTGPQQVHLVQAGGGPLGGDDLGLTVHLGPGTGLQVRSAAATVVQRGGVAGSAARWTMTAELADGSVLDWQPEPTVVCDGAQLDSRMSVVLRPGARAVLREVVVLGRAGQRGGRFRGELTVECGAPVLAHTLLLDGADPVLAGPAGTGGARVVGTLVVVGEGSAAAPVDAGEETGLRWACSTLDGPGRLLLALGDRADDVTRLLDRVADRVVLSWPCR